MIDTSDLESCTGKVIYPEGIAHGTAFFVGADLLLTSLHVVSGFKDDTFYVQMRDKTIVTVIVKAYCEKNDLALLITTEFQSQNFAVLCNENPLAGIDWATFGYPKTVEGLDVGTKLTGEIHDVISVKHQHDVVLNLQHGFVLIGEYGGLSGSAIINSQKQVTSVMRYKDNNTLCSVSVHKAENFLKENGVHVEEDQLNEFSTYFPDVFQAIADPFKSLGIAHAKVVAGRTSPQLIATALAGKLMIPEKVGTIKEVITYLKSHSIINKQVWLAWLEFLSYVQILRGKYEDINAVYISIPQVEISKFVEGVETKIKQDITLTLQFFFTEEKEYFTIAKQYLMDKSASNTLQHNHCHVFHSHTPMFGIHTFTKEDKKKIIPDIASPLDAGLFIAGEIDYGVLSFSELSGKVARSQSVAEATVNLTKIFIDAIS